MRSMIVRAFKDDGAAIVAFRHDASGAYPAISLFFRVFFHMLFFCFLLLLIPKNGKENACNY
jgi:hypothetical protein